MVGVERLLVQFAGVVLFSVIQEPAMLLWQGSAMLLWQGSAVLLLPGVAARIAMLHGFVGCVAVEGLVG